MKPLKNWDNRTWLSSKRYINQFHKFIKRKTKFNKNTRILDIGCGRAHIISFLHREYKFKQKPIGIDIIKNKNIKKNITFINTDANKYLKKNRRFDLIIIKQTVHFFDKRKLTFLLKNIKENLIPNGKLLIFSLKIKNNQIPCFKKMKFKLNESLKKDEKLINFIKKNLLNYRLSHFKFKVSIKNP